MVRKVKLSFRDAFTMIELIFAIVIIAISVMSLPMMTQVTSKGIESSLVQEAIFAASASLNEATTYYWDENSFDDSNSSDPDAEYTRVVNTGDCVAGVPNRRPGHVNRKCLSNNGTNPFAGAVFTDSINFAAHTPRSIFIAGSSPSSASYKNDYNSSLTVKTCIAANGCVQFGSSNNDPDIKQLEYTILDTTTGDTLVLLRAYSTNIGEAMPHSKGY